MTQSASPLRSAEVIAVGSELLGSTRLDTNSLYISERLSAIGIELRSKTVVGDNLALIAELCRQALTRVDLVVMSGGLGPTDDDLTREAIAAVVARPLREHAEIVENIAARFARRGLKMPDVNRRQGQVIQGAIVLANPNGTAPGQYVEHAAARTRATAIENRFIVPKFLLRVRAARWTKTSPFAPALPGHAHSPTPPPKSGDQ